MYRKIAMVVISVVISNFGVIVQVYLISLNYLGTCSIFAIDYVLTNEFEKRTIPPSSSQ